MPSVTSLSTSSISHLPLLLHQSPPSLLLCHQSPPSLSSSLFLTPPPPLPSFSSLSLSLPLSHPSSPPSLPPPPPPLPSFSPLLPSLSPSLPPPPSSSS